MYPPPSLQPNDKKRPHADGSTDSDGSAAKRPRVGPGPQTAGGGGAIDMAEIRRRLEEKKRELASRGVLPMPSASSSVPVAPSPSLTATSFSASASATTPAAPSTAAPAASVLEVERPRLDRSAPYFDRSLGIPSSLLRGRGGGRRGGKLHFVPQGKYVAKADKLRKEEKLAALKASLSATMKKVGVDASALEVIPDEVVQRAAPPLVEWWDLPLTHGYRTYEAMVGDTVDDAVPEVGDPAFFLFDTPVPMHVQASNGPDMAVAGEQQVVTPVTHFVQHPVPIPPPFSSPAPPRLAMLTKQERKKLRRQRRMEEQREKQDKIRLGLLAPEPPKVRLANLMRVLANEAIQDPTAVEANVRAQVEARRVAHEKANAERKLTPDQRRDKLERKKQRDERKGIHVAVFKCRDLAHPKIKFKVDMNVKQLGLTGLAVMFKEHHVVCVEGGPKAIRHFKKLMLRRIKWVGIDDEDTGAATGPSTATAANDGGDSEDEDDDAGGYAGAGLGVTASGSHVVGIDPSLQHCWLIWEGEHSHRLFSGFSIRKCYLESAAAKLFAEADAEHHWNHAKSWNPPKYT